MSELHVSSGASALGTTLGYNGSQIVEAGGTASGTVIRNGGAEYVAGVSYSAAVSFGGIQEIRDYGTVSGTTVCGGGTLCFDSGGYAWNTRVLGGGLLQVTGLDAVERGARVSSGGRLEVTGGGVSISAYFSAGASGDVCGWESWSGTVAGIISGADVVSASITVRSGGLAVSNLVQAGGWQYVSQGGAAAGTVIGSAGRERILGGGISYSAVVSGGKSEDPNEMENSGRQQVCAGGTAEGTVLKMYGRQIISGGMAAGTLVSSGGGQNIRAGGTAVDTVIRSGGFQNVSSGTAVGTVISRGGSQMLLGSGALDRGAVVMSGGRQYVCEGGGALSAKVSSGGQQIVSQGGSASGTVVIAEGTQILRGGTASAAVAYGVQTVSSGATAEGTIVRSGGRQYLFEGGTASGTTVSGGGSMVIKAGTVQGAAVQAGGAFIISEKSNAWAVAVSSGSVSAFRADTMEFKQGSVLGGSNLFSGVIVKGGADLVLAQGAAMSIYAWNYMKNLGSLTVGTSATLEVKDISNTLSKAVVYSSARTVFDITRVRASATEHMLSITSASKLNGTVEFAVARRQNAGVYELAAGVAVDSGKAFSVKAGTTALGSVTLGGSFTKYGVKYTAALSAGSLTLRLETVDGAMVKGTAGADTLKGTAYKGNVFYGGAGSDVIRGSGGRDIAFYDTKNWGMDTIAATTGTMAVVFGNGITSGNVKQVYDSAAKTMTLTRQTLAGVAASGQSIVISGWSDDTHSIVFGGSMAKVSAWTAAASPTAAVQDAARKEIWTKAGLLAG